MERKGLSLAFWTKPSGNALSHFKGLTKEQVEQLKELKEGDRLVLFKNDRAGTTQPSLTLKVSNIPADEGSGDSGGL